MLAEIFLWPYIAGQYNWRKDEEKKATSGRVPEQAGTILSFSLS